MLYALVVVYTLFTPTPHVVLVDRFIMTEEECQSYLRELEFDLGVPEPPLIDYDARTTRCEPQ